MYIFCHFDEVSAIRWSKMVTFSITGPKYSLRISLFLPETNDNPHSGLSFTTPIFNKLKNDHSLAEEKLQV